MIELVKEVTTSLLLEFYGQTLTGKQREVMELYYNEDLSLSEIAENQKISRQAALDSIRRAEKHLAGMEEKSLGCWKNTRHARRRPVRLNGWQREVKRSRVARGSGKNPGGMGG